MRIKKINEFNTNEKDLLMGGKISNEECVKLLDTLSSINVEAKKFKEVSNSSGLNISAFIKEGIINFVTDGVNPITLTVNIDAVFKGGDRVSPSPRFASKTSGYVPPRPGSETDKPLNPPKFGSRTSGYVPSRNEKME